MLIEANCIKRKCVHFLGIKNSGDETTERVVCAAYPDKIPDVIAYGTNKHKKVRDDQDNEIVFEKEE